jgi:hypothetical protein
MIDGTKIQELFAPIKTYIENNDVSVADARVVVLNHFPCEDQVREMAEYLKSIDTVDGHDYIEVTRKALTAALTLLARELIVEGKVSAEDTISEQEIEDELGDYMWDVDEVELGDIPYED